MEVNMEVLNLRRPEMAKDIRDAASLGPDALTVYKHVYNECRRATSAGKDERLTVSGIPLFCGPMKRPRKAKPQEIPLGL